MSIIRENTPGGVQIFDNLIYQYLNDYIERQKEENPDFSMEKATQSKWSAALLYIYKCVFKNNKYLKSDIYHNKNKYLITNNNKYDLDKVIYLLDIYINICYEYSKEVSIYGFSKLTGIEVETMLAWAGVAESGGSKPSSQGAYIVKRLTSENEESLSNLLISQRQPVALLGALNRRHGWNMSQPHNTINIKSISTSELPKLGNGSGGMLPG